MTDFGQRRRILPKTGQTTSYRDGDDGDLEKGWDEGERFKDVGDGTIIDNATGLMWPKDWSNDGGNNGNVLAWNDAVDWANALEFAGYSDWRLPNSIELFSLVNAEATAPKVYDKFENVISDSYYTSSVPDQGSAGRIWVAFTSTQIGGALYFIPYNVVAVRKA